MSRSSPTENSVECGWHDMGAIEGGRLEVGMLLENVSQNMTFDIAHKLKVTCALVPCSDSRLKCFQHRVKMPARNVTLYAGVPVET